MPVVDNYRLQHYDPAKVIFSLEVVAGNPLYTTTTNRLWGRLRFGICVW
jgi:hypothetical protein